MGYYTSIGVDAGGYPHISYMDYDNRNLKYAAFEGTGWDINIIDSNGSVGWNTSLALDAGGYPHVSYYKIIEIMTITSYSNINNEDSNGLKYAYAYCGYLLSGEINDDCEIDFDDFALMASDWIDSFNFDDLAVMVKNWLIDCDKTPGNPACIPK